MIHLDLTISGGILGGKLAQDPEEASYAITAMIEEAPSDFGEELAEYSAHAPDLVSSLRTLADQVEAAIAKMLDADQQ